MRSRISKTPTLLSPYTYPITPVKCVRLQRWAKKDADPHFCTSKSALSRPVHRNLTTTSLLSKHGGKQESKRTVSLNAAKTQSVDPFDLSDYKAAVSRAQEHLKSELVKVKAGGRNPSVVEDARVRLISKGKEDGKGNERGKRDSVRLGDIASVVKRGRNLAILVGEKEHLKPIQSSLLSAPHSFTINPSSPTDPLTLLIPIPPPTTEARAETQTLASKKGEEALFALKEARGARWKVLRAMELAKQVGPDQLRKAQNDLDKKNEENVKEVKGVMEGFRRGLEGP